MKINEMFVKDINRDITGVVKVAQQDKEEVKIELEEYVVTNELKSHFSELFEAYKKGITGITDKMGVWVSGFFGSGKSHFIKILSYLLRDDFKIYDKKPIEYFEDKIDDQVLLADIEKAQKVPTDVILFNVDSKSDSDSKNDKEAIIKVFNKVFNEHMGYCGSIPWLADLERQLDKEGNYNDFKNEFNRITGDKWEDKRADFYFIEEPIIDSLVETTQMNEESAKHWFRSSEENYTISIEKFAKRVQNYIEKQGNNHHVLFLVDEIGQYIGDDGQLMLNLQTVAEDLGIHCGGKAWVMVTSQEEISEVTKRIKNMDFSKIMGRFDTRLSLSSTNVDEVITKRLLEKSDLARDTLELLYNDKSAILNNIITFSDDTYEMKNYSNLNEFVNIYPFIPYQFQLLQEVFEEIRKHGATGKHLSEGERSLLSAFQESAQKYNNSDIGKLVPFSAFFDPIDSFLDSNISRVISNAKANRNLEEYDIEVLKLLFLIRYIQGLPGNIENLTTLMVSNIEEDKIALKERIKDSLNRLLKETVIQKNGNEYFFLTNAEQDINKEIKNTNVDISQVIQETGDIIFEEIYNNRKFRYNNEYDFSFNQIVDEKTRGSQKEDIGINILTPYYGEISDSQLLLESNGENNVILKLPNDTDFIEELEKSLKIEKYLRKRSSSKMSDTIDDIISRIQREQHDRKKRVKEILKENIKESTIYVRGQKIEFTANNPKSKIDEGFETLIKDKYHKLNYISEHINSDKELYDLIEKDHIKLTLNKEDVNKLAYDEVQHYIDSQEQMKNKVTLKNVINNFKGIPYGWKQKDIISIVIKLMKAKEINLQYNGEIIGIDNDRLPEYLTKRSYFEKLIIKNREKVDQELIGQAKNLGRDLFEKIDLPSDEDKLRKKLMKFINNEIIVEARNLLNNYNGNNYPGKEDLVNAQAEFDKIYNKKDTYSFYKAIYDKYNTLIDYGEKINRISQFFNNQQKFYDKAKEAIELYEKNETYIEDEDIIEVIDELKKIVNKEEPYSEIHRIPELRNKFHDVFFDMIKEKCKPVEKTIKNDKDKIKEELDKYDFEEHFNNKLLDKFDRLLKRLNQADNVNEIKSMKTESDTIKRNCINKINKKLKSMKEDEDGIDIGGPTIKEKEVETIYVSDLMPDSREIKNENDIEELLEEIRNELKNYLDDDKEIKLM